MCLSRLKLSAALAGLSLATILSTSARSEEPKLSISGYDPVAYFTDGKPVQGKAEIEHLWHKLRWRFASEAHRVGANRLGDILDAMRTERTVIEIELVPDLVKHRLGDAHRAGLS